VNSLPKTVIRQRRDYDLNPGPSAPESSTLITRLPSHSLIIYYINLYSAGNVSNTKKQHYSSLLPVIPFPWHFPLNYALFPPSLHFLSS